MKKTFYLLTALGLLIIVYAVVGKYSNEPTISLAGAMRHPMRPVAGILVGNTMLLLAILSVAKGKANGMAKVLALAGVLVFSCAVLGRVVGVPTISLLGYVPAMTAGMLAIAANTMLLLAVLLIISAQEK
jgi:hypothetical protein